MTPKITPHQLTCEYMDNSYTVLESDPVATEAEGVRFVRYEEGVAVFEHTSVTLRSVAS